MEQQFAGLICRARKYQSSVSFINGTNQQEAMVSSMTNATRTRPVVFTSEHQTWPSLCSYSTVRDGFPCLYGVILIFQRWGVVSLHKYISFWNLSSTWKLQYQGVSFGLPLRVDLDRVIIRTKHLVASLQSMRITVAPAPPHGRQVKQFEKNSRYWSAKGVYRIQASV